MKISIAISILILLIAASIGWRDHGKLAAAREDYFRFVSKAGTLGFALAPSNPSKTVRLARHEREVRDPQAHNIISEFIAYGKEIEASGDSNFYSRERNLDLHDLFISLDSEQIEAVIVGVWSNAELAEDTRQKLIGSVLYALASVRPQAVVALFSENTALFKTLEFDGALGRSLAIWTKDNPSAAKEWIQKNDEKFPDLFITEGSKRDLIHATAFTDPTAAYKMIGQLGITKLSYVLEAIARVPTTDADRDRTLAALRDHLQTITDEKVRAETDRTTIHLLVQGAVASGFEAGSKWIAASNFTPQETQTIATTDLRGAINPHETGKWIEWAGQTLPAEISDETVGMMVSNWTSTDHAAAGKWLSTAPEGPVKNTAVQTFAQTVAPYQPETAAQWAMTLPPGEIRDSTLNQIYQNWPREDPASASAAEAFAKEHGLK